MRTFVTEHDPGAPRLRSAEDSGLLRDQALHCGEFITYKGGCVARNRMLAACTGFRVRFRWFQIQIQGLMIKDFKKFIAGKNW